MPYQDDFRLVLKLLVLAVLIAVIYAVLRFRQTRAQGAARRLIALELLIGAGAVITLDLTQSLYSSDRHLFDANPFAGVRSPNFPRLFTINFLLLPALVAPLVALRIPHLHRAGPALVAAASFYLIVEAAQYVRGGERVASTQDVLLSTFGACALALIVGSVAEAVATKDGRDPRHASRIWLGILALSVPLVAVNFIPDASPKAYALPGPPSSCGLPEGEWAIPEHAPTSEWQQAGKVTRPSSPTQFGPGTVTGNAATCFGRNPAGALFAAAWAMAR